MKYKAFTLAELLVALLILSVIATFTIPKVLVSSQNAQFKAVGKEAAGMVAAAYQAYSLNNTVTSATKFSDITPFMNYVKVDTSSSTTIDYFQGTSGAYQCAWEKCLILHSGAIIYFDTAMSFNGTNSTNGISFLVDPDGKYSGTSTGPGKSLELYLFSNGRLTTSEDIPMGTKNSDGTFNGCGNCDPPWFDWN